MGAAQSVKLVMGQGTKSANHALLIARIARLPSFVTTATPILGEMEQACVQCVCRTTAMHVLPISQTSVKPAVLDMLSTAPNALHVTRRASTASMMP